MLLQIEQIDKTELQSLIAESINTALLNFTPPSPKTDEKLLNTREASEILKVSELTVFNWRTSGKLPSMKMGGRYYYKYSDILNAMAGRQ